MAKKRMKLIEDDGFIPGNSDGVIDWNDEEPEEEKVKKIEKEEKKEEVLEEKKDDAQ